jgi:hypothetical protein
MSKYSDISPPPAFWEVAVEHRRQISDALRSMIDRFMGPLGLPNYTVATPSDTRPSAADYEGCIIYASDTQKVQFSDGATWADI